MRDALERLDINPRGTTASEQIDSLTGRALYIDQGAAGERAVASPRLSGEMLRAIIDSLRFIDANLDEFQRALWEDLEQFRVEQGPVEFDPQAYARHVASLDADDPARRALEALADLFRAIDQSGLSPAEADVSKRKAAAILASPGSITADQLAAAVEAYIRIMDRLAADR